MPIQLYPYQEAPMPHLQQLVEANSPLIILAASTGFGKTIISLELMRRTQKKFGVIAPRATLSAWNRTAKAMGVIPEFVLNIENLRTGNKKRTGIISKLSNYSWTWNSLKTGDYLLVDEFQVCSGMETQNAYMVANARKQGINVVASTATLGDSTLKLRLLLYLAGLVPWKEYYQWLRDNGGYRDANITGHPWRFVRGAAAISIMSEINQKLFPKFGVRLRSEEIKSFPQVQNFVDLVTPSDEARRAVREAYASMSKELKDPTRAPNQLVQILHWRMRVELEKLHTMRELVDEALEDGLSVVVFFCFIEPLFKFAEMMKAQAPSLIYGSDPAKQQQTKAERDESVRRFQANETRLCLASFGAGGVGLSLGDEHGGHPRIAFHNLCLDSVSLVQGLGRIHRANSKTPSINKIVLIEGVPIETRVFRLLSAKISNLSALQADSLDLSKLLNED